MSPVYITAFIDLSLICYGSVSLQIFQLFTSDFPWNTCRNMSRVIEQISKRHIRRRQDLTLVPRRGRQDKAAVLDVGT